MISLPPQDIIRLKNSAKIAQAVENKFVSRVEDLISEARISNPESFDVPDFENLFAELWFETYIRSFKHAQSERDLDKRLASPKSLKKVMELYDKWRKGLFKPVEAKKFGKELKRLYIETVQKAWKKYSEDFREGGEQTQVEIRDQIKKSAKTTTARAQTIVRTETCRYYNKARKDYYDSAEDVTHYLFLAVRDKATTPWCAPNKINGKRGRSGLVYAKDDPLLKKETPPVHWNCRSEILPLNKHNPSHRKLIEDRTIQRRNHECHPLPPGWN